MTDLGARFLGARDERQQDLLRVLADATAAGAASVLFLSTNVPGPEKQRPGLARLVHQALADLAEALPLKVVLSRTDLLGPFHLAYSTASSYAVKRAAVALEARDPAARLLDIDVYRPDGTQVDRALLGLPQRACLLCAEPARECMRSQRHGLAELQTRVEALLQASTLMPERIAIERLAATLHQGALRELAVTPKPGLVDRRDNGSHPDLSFALMSASAQLLPAYYGDLLQRFHPQGSLEAYVEAGRAAETRMFQAIHANGHKGYIFLSGLVLLAACQCQGRMTDLRPALADLAGRFFAFLPALDSHGSRLRDQFGLGGIRVEAERGLPALFDHGWPAYRAALQEGCPPERAAFHLLAALMQSVEDSTAVQRCGLEGLARLHRDGQALQAILSQGRDPEDFLTALNEDYRRANLTMGGVADCMALTFALDAAAQGGSSD
jgi:triphosphoribosyl-dephospho-CoA synthase